MALSSKAWRSPTDMESGWGHAGEGSSPFMLMVWGLMRDMVF